MDYNKDMAKKRDAELLELGKKLQDFYDSGYVDRKQVLWFSFAKGLAGGLGAFLGGTIVIGLLLWTLSFFQDVPGLSHFVKSFQHTLETKAK